jgi:hypothetical protein
MGCTTVAGTFIALGNIEGMWILKLFVGTLQAVHQRYIITIAFWRGNVSGR